MAKSRVRARGPGPEDLKKLLKKKIKLRVGVMGAKASTKYAGGTATVAEIADIHENGRGVPQRSWLNGWVEEDGNHIKTQMRKAAEIVVKKRVSPAKVLEAVGADFVGKIQARMSLSPFKPLEQSTIDRRKHGGTKPLIDTGRLRSSITYKVVE